MYWQYTTALAGVGLSVVPATPSRTLAANPATVNDFIGMGLVERMMLLLFLFALES
jgi:hypothetical protein